MKAVTLDKEQLDIVLKYINQPTPRQAARICEHLAYNLKSPTVTINTTCSVGNLSDTVRKDINPRIYSIGLMVGCEKPAVAIQNKFNQPSGQHLWSFFKLPDAANDSLYDVAK